MINNKKLVVVMPAYNAALTLEKTYKELPLDIVDEVILVDDASADNTADIASSLGIEHVLVHDRNLGYGGNQKTCYQQAMALGADGIAVSNAAIQAIGCLGMRACHTNNCPVGIATQQPHLRARLPVDDAAQRLARYFASAVHLMQVLARAAGHRHLKDFEIDDLTTYKTDMAQLTGIAYGGVAPMFQE